MAANPQNIKIRPEEEKRKVVIKVIPTCGDTVELGDVRVSLWTNRQGGVVAPFILYAMSYHDPRLEFYDPDTGERLGDYVPPPQEKEDKSLIAIQSVAEAIQTLIAHGLNLSPDMVKNLQKDGMVNQTQADQLKNGTLNKQEPINARSAAHDLLDNAKTPWTERLDAIEKVTDTEILLELKVILQAKPKLGKTNEKVLDMVSKKLAGPEGQDLTTEQLTITLETPTSEPEGQTENPEQEQEPAPQVPIEVSEVSWDVDEDAEITMAGILGGESKSPVQQAQPSAIPMLSDVQEK